MFAASGAVLLGSFRLAFVMCEGLEGNTVLRLSVPGCQVQGLGRAGKADFRDFSAEEMSLVVVYRILACSSVCLAHHMHYLI